MDPVRLTLAVATVLKAFAKEPQQPRYGYDLMRETGFASGKLYPILARLTVAGWLLRTEQLAPSKGPARVSYVLSSEGAHEARDVLRSLRKTLI